MVSTFMRDHGAQLVSSGKLPMNRLDDAVRRILRVKFRAGLFENPYVDVAQADAAQLQPEAVQAARDAAGKSMVLLKNDGPTMPLSKSADTAVIGPLADSKHDMLGPWWGRGDDNDAVSVREGIEKNSTGTTTFAQACTLGHKDPPENDDSQECADTTGFAHAVEVAQAADQVVLAVGESREMSGEAAARSVIDLPGEQEELVRQIVATGKPVAVVLFNGRPLTLGSVADDAKAILEAWFPGVQAGNAVADVVFGDVNPGGKLPVSFPWRVGQVPIYYNHEPTGRPCDVNSKWDSRYRDLKSCDPQFVFGYGLSYTTFDVSGPKLSATSVSKNGKLTATVRVKNTGSKAGDEVVQLYIHDPVASISQPVRRLRGFERVTLAPGAEQDVTFTLDRSDWGFYDNRGKFVVEAGKIEVYAGSSSKADKMATFTVTG
jgi:beta-glucosidase